MEINDFNEFYNFTLDIHLSDQYTYAKFAQCVTALPRICKCRHKSMISRIEGFYHKIISNLSDEDIKKIFQKTTDSQIQFKNNNILLRVLNR